MSCHGLGYSIDALADAKLALANFPGKAGVHVKSPEMVAQRLKDLEAKRRSRTPGAAADERK
jgi:hypothetical protein